MKGIILSGEFGNVLAREKSDTRLELGELLISETGDIKTLLQVTDLIYGSQLNQANLELVSGLKLEEDTTLGMLDGKLRMYVLARLKNIITIQDGKVGASKHLPPIFSPIKEVTKQDLSFITQPVNPLFLGNLRSGSKTLDVPISVKGDDVLPHHILVAGATGRGKSVLMSNILWNTLEQDYCGMLVIDPHDEYYGRTKPGLKDHQAKDRLAYYTRKPYPGARTLMIPLKRLRPRHLTGVLKWTDAQTEALYAYSREFGEEWIEAIVTGKLPREAKFHESTIDVIKRRLQQVLNIEVANDTLTTRGVFTTQGGESILIDIANDLQQAKTVIIDTSELSGSMELLIASLLAHEILHKYRNMSFLELQSKPAISIVLEEAPRVLGHDIVERGDNVFGTIAREGRKFKVGLLAITQLPSLIPRQILANLNTKILLGIELKQEREAIIQSAAQDLSADDRAISSLDKGEAIVSSTFLRFATPIRIPNFVDVVKEQKALHTFEGIK